MKIECDTCEGAGETMTAVCYGGPVHEITETCPDCDGEGVIPTSNPDKKLCDCGGHITKTTHSNWCSVLTELSSLLN